MAPLVSLLLFAGLSPVFAADSFPLVASIERVGRVEIRGNSFLSRGKPVKSGVVAPSRVPALGAWLVWSSELSEKSKNPPVLRLLTPKGPQALSADWSGWKESAGWVYAAAADVTDLLSEGFTILPPPADPVHVGDPVPYSHSGWALIRIEKPSGKRSLKRRVRLYLGPEVLPPAELYSVPLDDTGVLSEVGVIGGHGMPGNAAGNLLNGLPITGGRDWSGAAGERWDASLVAVSAKVPYQLEFDPLLQWIVPVAVVTVSSESKE